MTKNNEQYNLVTTSKIIIPGFHCWKNAPERFSYLSTPHRHLFHISVEVYVSESRKIEFIDFGIDVKKFLYNSYPKSIFGKEWTLDFQNNSCEDIAAKIFNHFSRHNSIKTVSVFEDGENGATLYAQ